MSSSKNPMFLQPCPSCVSRIQENSWILFLLIMAAIFWIYRLVKVFCNTLSYWEIRQFYIKALKIRMVSWPGPPLRLF